MKKKKIRNSMKLLLLVSIICATGFHLNHLNQKIELKSNNPSSYIFSKDSLMSSLYELSKYDNRIIKIIENKEAYPESLLEMLTRNIDLTDYVLDYNQNKTQVFAETIGETKKGEYPLLLQYDKRWGYGLYGENVIAINGCGPTSVAMIIAGLTGRNDITPYKVATYAYNKGYYDNGTSWSFFTNGVKYFGIVGTTLPLSKSKMLNELKENHPIICSMRPGDFTTTGHIIAITGTKEGKFIINDPNSKERSNKLWSYEQLEPQIKNLWSFQKL